MYRTRCPATLQDDSKIPIISEITGISTLPPIVVFVTIRQVVRFYFFPFRWNFSNA
jgi:hypothetical protein